MTPFKLNVMTIAVVLLSSVGFTAGFLVPGMRGLSETREKVAAEQATVVDRQREVGDVSAVYRELMELSKDVRDFRTQLPNDRQAGAFLNELSDVLTACSIRDYLVQPQPAQRVVADMLPEELKVAAGTGILPVKVAFEAEFRDAFTFIDRLESLPRLVYIEQLEMKMPEDGAGNLSVSMVVYAYHQNHEALGIFPLQGEPILP